jgi:hypothetical protein
LKLASVMTLFALLEGFGLTGELFGTGFQEA